MTIYGINYYLFFSRRSSHRYVHYKSNSYTHNYSRTSLVRTRLRTLRIRRTHFYGPLVFVRIKEVPLYLILILYTNSKIGALASTSIIGLAVSCLIITTMFVLIIICVCVCCNKKGNLCCVSKKKGKEYSMFSKYSYIIVYLYVIIHFTPLDSKKKSDSQ